MKPLYNQVMSNTKRNTWGGSRAGSGRRRKATCSRNGRVYVALDMVSSVVARNGTMIRHYHGLDKWFVDGVPFTDYASAAAEFVRRVNGTK